jgi:hypothetical protein
VRSCGFKRGTRDKNCTTTMSEYRRGFSVEQLREQFLADAEVLDDTQMRARYGADRGARFLGLRPNDQPTSNHLRSPMYRDERGREYTPQSAGRSTVWWIRIPPSIARREHILAAAGSLGAGEETQFPADGEQLRLTRVYKDAPSAPITVTVDRVVSPKQASSEVMFVEEVDATWSDRELAHLKLKAEYRERRNTRRLAAADE